MTSTARIRHARYLGAAALAMTVYVMAGCDDAASTGTCAPQGPGMRFVIHLDVEGEPPGELGVRYANGEVERFDDLLPASSWTDPLQLCVRYGANAADGPATASFSSRPDPARGATAEFVADLTSQVTVELDLQVLVDAGAQ